MLINTKSFELGEESGKAQALADELKYWIKFKEKIKPIIEDECRGKQANCYVIKKAIFELIDERIIEIKKQLRSSDKRGKVK